MPYPSLDSGAWKRKKAKTVLGETVTKALVQMEKAQGPVLKAGEQATFQQLSQLSQQLTTLQAEIKKTRGKCKKGIHDATASLLDEMGKEAVKYTDEVGARAKEWTDFLKQFDMYLKHTRSSLEAVVKSPQPAVIARNKVPVAGALKWMHGNIDRLRPLGTDALKKSLLFTNAIDVFEALERAQPKAKAGGKPVPATPADLKKPLDEARALIRQLK